MQGTVHSKAQYLYTGKLLHPSVELAQKCMKGQVQKQLQRLVLQMAYTCDGQLLATCMMICEAVVLCLRQCCYNAGGMYIRVTAHVNATSKGKDDACDMVWHPKQFQ